MEKEMTLISAKGKLKGIWGEAVNPIEEIGRASCRERV